MSPQAISYVTNECALPPTSEKQTPKYKPKMNFENFFIHEKPTNTKKDQFPNVDTENPKSIFYDNRKSKTELIKVDEVNYPTAKQNTSKSANNLNSECMKIRVISSNEGKNQPLESKRSLQNSKKFTKHDNQNIHESEEVDTPNKMPCLKSNNPNHILEFKQRLIEMILHNEIFNEDENIKFFEAVCSVNADYDREIMIKIFEYVKDYFLEQFQDLEENQNSNE
jgi:hypothetical protein